MIATTSNEKVTSLLKSKRFYIAMLLFASVTINYIDRVNLSVAAPLISKEFGWDPGTMGILFSSFLWTYSLALIPCGWLGDKFGSRKVNAVATAIWSLGAMLTGAATNFGNMIATRLVLGAGEAACYPLAAKTVRQWFPANERATAIAIYNAGAFAGPALATPLAAWMVLETGWRMSFLILGSLGFIWVYFWIKMFRLPEESKWVSEEEKQYIISSRDNNSNNSNVVSNTDKPIKISLGRILNQKTMWGIAISQGCIVYSQYLFLTWLPSYLVQARGMQLMKAGIYSALPFVIAVILGIIVGKMSDRILDSEKMRKGNRRTAVVTSMLVSSIVLLTNMVTNEFVVLALISIALTAISSALSLNFALTNDLIAEPRITGTVIATQMLGGNLFGLTAPIITGYIVKITGNFDSAFILAGVLLILGALVSFTLTRKPIVYDDYTGTNDAFQL